LQSVPDEVPPSDSTVHVMHELAPSLEGLRELGWGILAPWKRDQRGPNPHNICAGRAELKNVRPSTVSNKEGPPDQTHAHGPCKNQSNCKIASSVPASVT